MVTGTLRGNSARPFSSIACDSFGLAVGEIGLTQRAVELRHPRIFEQQRLQIGNRRAGLRALMSATALP